MTQPVKLALGDVSPPVGNRRLKQLTLETTVAHSHAAEKLAEASHLSLTFSMCVTFSFIIKHHSFIFHSAPGDGRLLSDSFKNKSSATIQKVSCALQCVCKHVLSWQEALACRVADHNPMSPLNMPFNQHPKMKAAVKAWDWNAFLWHSFP